jgi:hypothetical protein
MSLYYKDKDYRIIFNNNMCIESLKTFVNTIIIIIIIIIILLFIIPLLLL